MARQLTLIFQSILRTLGSKFTFSAFKTQLEIHKKTFNPAQLAGLEQRMSILNAFMTVKPKEVAEQQGWTGSNIDV